LKKFAFQIHTFGCKVSQYESQAIREHWLELGGYEEDAPSRADVILVASCAVTAEAVADARQAVRRLGRQAPQARVVVSGCAADAAREDFRLPGVRAVIPQIHKGRLLSFHPLDIDSAMAGGPPDASFPPFRIAGFRRARPILKVQDGCSQGCAYCIVPLARGPSRSREPGEIMDEARRLLAAGYREIVVSGINLRQYRYGRENFWKLLRQLETGLAPRWAGRARLRLSSLDPAQLDAEGLECLEACRLLCPHLHLSLQSGSPSVLRRMRRDPLQPERMPDVMAAVRRFWPVFGLGADILTGFPGETADETEDTLAMLAGLPLTYAHVFPWSPRPGTEAAGMPDALPKGLRQERAAMARAVVEPKRRAFLRAQAALPEFRLALDGKGSVRGVNEYYAPCRVEGEISLPGGALLPVRPVEARGDHLVVLVLEQINIENV
jgi:MiaB/RimO family radical SAM methylthiotransferase